jgi:hypothetical protein
VRAHQPGADRTDGDAQPVGELLVTERQDIALLDDLAELRVEQLDRRP